MIELIVFWNHFSMKKIFLFSFWMSDQLNSIGITSNSIKRQSLSEVNFNFYLRRPIQNDSHVTKSFVKYASKNVIDMPHPTSAIETVSLALVEAPNKAFSFLPKNISGRSFNSRLSITLANRTRPFWRIRRDVGFCLAMVPVLVQFHSKMKLFFNF